MVFRKMIPRGKTDNQEQKFVISLLKTESGNDDASNLFLLCHKCHHDSPDLM